MSPTPVEGCRARNDSEVTEELKHLASSHHGVILPRDLGQLGLDDCAMRAALRRLHKVGRGVYTIERPASPLQVHYFRAVAALRRQPGRTAAHVSAAVIHQLPLFRPDLEMVHLFGAESSRLGKRGTALVHRPIWGPSMTVDGVPVTTVAQTIVDCARTQSRETAVVMADSALHLKLTTVAELREAAARVANLKGASRARSVVELADGRAESVGETRARLICLDAGIGVTPQVEVRDDDGLVITRLDLKVDGYCLGLAFDGRGKYHEYLKPGELPDQKYWEEKLQAELVEDRGWVRVNVYWNMLDHPELVVGRINRGKARALKLAR